VDGVTELIGYGWASLSESQQAEGLAVKSFSLEEHWQLRVDPKQSASLSCLSTLLVYE